MGALMDLAFFLTPVIIIGSYIIQKIKKINI